MKRAFAHCDVNTCYTSCERVFNPKLEGKPVVVLSNNDGCAISVSSEAKALGIRMTAPWYQIKDIATQHGVIVLSSNYTLYGELSQRFMDILGDFVSPDEQEVYSIDESFLDLTAFQQLYDLNAYAHLIRNRVRKWIGLPICIGIGSTKTLAKLADFWAKKHPQFSGVCNINDMSEAVLMRRMARTEVGEVWGIGRRSARKLHDMGIHTIEDLVRADQQMLQKRFGVNLGRTIRELNGIVCHELTTITSPKQQIVSSRSFGNLITELEPIKSEMRYFVSQAVTKLRKDRSVCGLVGVFLMTNRHRTQDRQYHKSTYIRLPYPTDDLYTINHAAMCGIEQLFKIDFNFKKAGVCLMALQPASMTTQDLFAGGACEDRRERLNVTLAEMKGRFGPLIAQIGNVQAGSKARMRREHKSPDYLTNWHELPLLY